MTDHQQTIDEPGRSAFDRFVPLNEAAERAGVTPSKLRELAAADQIAARKVAGRWLVDERVIPVVGELISQTSRKPGQGARIEQALERIGAELEVLQGAIDVLDERLQNFGNLIATYAGIGQRIATEPPQTRRPDVDDDREYVPVLSSVAELADQIIADQSSIEAQQQVERADRDLRTHGLIH